MENIEIIKAIAFFGIFFTLLIIGISDSKYYFKGKSGKISYTTICNVLYKYEYFNKLTINQKDLFIKKVNRFNNKIKYFGENGLNVSDEMRIIIAAGFTKLTLATRLDKLYFFHSIILYPKAYHEEAKRLKHLGKTSPQGYIAFSWEDILKGEADLHDGVNLAIHEFAHAFVVEMMQDKIIHSVNYLIIRQIYFTGKKEIDAINNGKEPVFRKYAYSSPHEFFAIAVEVFFELPEKLIKNHWKTYRNLCFLFNQNPLANEIGKVNWKSILEYPHEQGIFASLKETKSFEFASIGDNKMVLEVDNKETRIIKKGPTRSTISFTCPHSSFLYATMERVNGGYNEQFNLFYLKDDKITCSKFLSKDHFGVSDIIDLYYKIGLSS